MSRRHTLAVNERDKKWSIHHGKKMDLRVVLEQSGGHWDTSGQKRAQTIQKLDMVQMVGWKRRKKLDTEVDREEDGTAWERAEAGGSGTEAKRDTSTAR